MFTSNRHINLVSSLALILLFNACGANQEDAASTSEELDGIPELSAVQMHLTEAAEEGGATSADFVDPEDMGEVLELVEVPEDAAEDMVTGQHAIGELNQALRSFLAPIVKLVRTTEPTRERGALRVWGPVTRGETEYRLLVRSAAAGEFAWRLEARRADSTDKFQRIALGRLERGSVARRGKGALGVDLDALSEVNGEVEARGKVLVGFRHGNAGTTVAYALESFTPDGNREPIDALLRGVHTKSGFNRVRLAFHGDVAGSETDAEELVLARLRHQRGLGGRSDLLVVGGDVPEGQLWVRSQCWTAKLGKTFSEVQTCPLETPIDLSACTVLETHGEVTACDKGLRDPELPPVDPQAPMADDKDPNADVDVPTALDELADPDM